MQDVKVDTQLSSKWTRKDTGSLLTGVGSIMETMATIESNRSVMNINAENAIARMDDIRQINTSMNDNVKQLIRGSRRAGGRLKTAVASSNLVMEGSPLMALEELYQQGVQDVKGLQDQARYRVASIGKQIDMDYLKTISTLKARETGATLSAITSFARAGE